MERINQNELSYESGTLGKLRIQLLSFMLFADKIRTDSINTPDSDIKEIDRLIEHFELFLKDCAVSQQFADKMVVNLNDEERKLLFQKLPQIQEIFGWRDKFDEEGKITKK